jgi:ABC-type bacteriocin/lantibiotic exporter with double-glycine peptidase domain
VKLQERGYSCGPAALRAALYVLGHNLTESALRRRAGTTTWGTDEKGIVRAVNYYGHGSREYNSESIKRSWSWLKNTVGRGKPVLLCVDGWSHWVAVVGKLGGKLLVFDPDSTGGRRKRYSGLEVFNEHDLGTRWRYDDEETGRSNYYAIAVIS